MENDKIKIQQKDIINYIETDIDDAKQIYVYKKLPFNGMFYSAFIPNAEIENSLKYAEWDICAEEGLPSCTKYGENIVYHQYGQGKIQPLVIQRKFYGIKPTSFEISEEFRFYHNLYFDKKENKYIKIDNNGDETDIIVIEDNGDIRIDIKAIKQFLAIKNMSLLFLFDCYVKSKYTLEELKLEEKNINIHNENMSYMLYYSNYPYDGYKTLSRLLGKKIIKGYSKEKCGIWPYDEKEEEYQTFIIDVNKDGEECHYTSNPDELSDFFGKNQGAPNYLTPIYFKKDVLEKYYNNNEKYRVEDGYIACGNLWGLKIDNDKKNNVVVFLGDLGKLSSKEQLHWKSYNIPPDGSGISKTCFTRSFMANFCDAESIDFKFLNTFQTFNQNWNKKFGWTLFVPLSQDDSYHYQTFHCPLNTQKDFDEQIRSLVKIIIDSINEQELKKNAPPINETGSIKILKKYLENNKITYYDSHIEFLKNLQTLRSTSIAHRKGANYIKIANYFGIPEKTFSKVFNEILNDAISFIKFLEVNFL